MEKERYRRGSDAPRIEIALWVRTMARRVEAQLSRDWHFGFLTWNYLFRTSINLSRTVFSYEPRGDRSGPDVTAATLEEGAICLFRALAGTYKDMAGKTQKVKGDMTKLRYVPDLSDAATRLLRNIEHLTRKLPGTQGARRQMRFDTHANRVRYGVPIFVTFTPDEGHNAMMMRLSRTRRNDPVLTSGHDEVGRRVCGRLDPSMEPLQTGDVEARVDLEALLRHYPEYQQRVALMARNPLASVDGFRTIVMLTYRFLFGMKVCPFCPDCNNGEHSAPCQDIFGNSSVPEGGVFGRIEAGFTSIEAQKSKGSLHAHSQLFVQCLHQHTPLSELLVELASRGNIVKDYLTYKAHVSRQVYADPQRADARLPLLEADWPEYPQSTALLPVRKYLTEQAPQCPANSEHAPGLTEARNWLREIPRGARARRTRAPAASHSHHG